MGAAAWLLATLLVTAGGAVGPYEGFRALVVQPEHSWGWDSAVFGALQERGFDTDYGPLPLDAAVLSRYDLVALSIRRRLGEAEAGALERYVADGGAVYGSWGGPMGSPQFLRRVCHVRATRSLRIGRIRLLDGPLCEGIGAVELPLSERMGHRKMPEAGWEIVSVQPAEGGIVAAEDMQGRPLGVLSRYGQGRTAVLGFGPENDKYYADVTIGPALMDNLLRWLLPGEERQPRAGWSGRVAVAVPARARNLLVSLDGKQLSAPDIRQVGSLKLVGLDLAAVRPGHSVSVRIGYALVEGRDVEAVIHLPWGTLRAAARSPARLAEYLEWLRATTCIPLLRSSFGRAWYKGMPEDRPDEVLVARYKGNFLADLVRECHARGIAVVADVYLDNSEPLRKHPEVARLDREGKPIKDRYGRLMACFNNPKAQEHNLATFRQLLDDYELDGVILDDNFELDRTECYCGYCKDGFRHYCERNGLTYVDPAATRDPELERNWRLYKQEATRALCARVREIARAHGVPAGGWVGVGADHVHLAAALDYLGGMVYSVPPRAARAPLSLLGERRFVCLLWAPDVDPDAIEREAHEAVRAGCAAVGYWIRGEDGGYEMDPARAEAIRRALGGLEDEWLAFYRDNLVRGDPRFVVTGGQVRPNGLQLTLKNAGRRSGARLEGRVMVRLR